MLQVTGYISLRSPRPGLRIDARTFFISEKVYFKTKEVFYEYKTKILESCFGNTASGKTPRASVEKIQTNLCLDLPKFPISPKTL
jgi:hypothetical protein